MIRVHILNVGHGDCIVIEYPDDGGRLTVVDINRSKEMDKDSLFEVVESINPNTAIADRFLFDSGMLKYSTLLEQAGYDITLTDPLPYIKILTQKEYNTNNTFRFISTHPHMDHLSGLSDLNQNIGMTNAWVLDNSYTQDLFKLSETQKVDWKLYKSLRDGTQDAIKIVRPFANTEGDFWTEDGIEILAPTHELLKDADHNGDANGMSYVLLITHGYSKVVLGGDAEKKTWEYIVENHSRKIKNIHLLKASHHGRDSGYHQPAVKLMNPEYTAVSVGKKPDTDASNKYRQYSENVVSTRWYGTMVFELHESGEIYFQPEHERCTNRYSTIMSGKAVSW